MAFAYKTCTVFIISPGDTQEIDNTINKWVEEGWEFVQVTHIGGSSAFSVLLLFRKSRE